MPFATRSLSNERRLAARCRCAPRRAGRCASRSSRRSHAVGERPNAVRGASAKVFAISCVRVPGPSRGRTPSRRDRAGSELARLVDSRDDVRFSLLVHGRQRRVGERRARRPFAATTGASRGSKNCLKDGRLRAQCMCTRMRSVRRLSPSLPEVDYCRCSAAPP